MSSIGILVVAGITLLMAAAVTGGPLEPRQAPAAQPVPPGVGTTFEGSGAMLTPPFALAGGEVMFYFEPPLAGEVGATRVVAPYKVILRDMDGNETVLFEGMETMLRELKQMTRGGIYYLEVHTDGEWSIKVTVTR